jgi:lactoylglutathione lyase
MAKDAAKNTAKAIHTMIRVLDEARSVSFYDKAFGLKVAERLDFPDFTLVYLSNEETPFEVELTINKDRAAPYQLGDGYGHVAFSVDDIEREHARFAAAGLSPRRSSSSIARADCSRGFSSSRIRMDTRSRFCSGAVASNSGRFK